MPTVITVPGFAVTGTLPVRFVHPKVTVPLASVGVTAVGAGATDPSGKSCTPTSENGTVVAKMYLGSPRTVKASELTGMLVAVPLTTVLGTVASAETNALDFFPKFVEHTYGMPAAAGATVNVFT
jgi:hypothetical protein